MTNYQTDPALADFIRRCRNGEQTLTDEDRKADREERRKARTRESSRISHQRKRDRQRQQRLLE